MFNQQSERDYISEQNITSRVNMYLKRLNIKSVIFKLLLVYAKYTQYTLYKQQYNYFANQKFR